MKNKNKAIVISIVAALFALWLSACSSTQGTTSNAIKVANLALQTYSAYQSKDPAAVAKAVSDDLYGAASLAEAYQGGNAGAIVQGARYATAMAGVVAALPPGTLDGGNITPETVATLLTAAALVQ